MAQCIYCRCQLPTVVSPEHVIPQSFGVFKPDLTLTCVCDPCNRYFGTNLEWPMRVESLEGALRLHFGRNGVVGDIGTRGITPTIAEGADWIGARTAIYTKKNGKQSTKLLPQVGARRSPDDKWEWLLAHELTTDFTNRFPQGSEFRILGGQSVAGNQRLVEQLIAVCPTFVYGGALEPPLNEDGKVVLHIETQLSRTSARCISKIAFNYMAFACGNTFALSREFDTIRDFIRNDVGDEQERVFLKQTPIIFQEILYGERVSDGHILTIDCRPHHHIVEAQVALFNSIHYKVPMCSGYFGGHFTSGHHFDTHSWKVSEMKVMRRWPAS